MSATTIRIRPKSHQALKDIAAATGRSVQDELDWAIEQRQRTIYLEGLNADYAALAQDPKALADFKRKWRSGIPRQTTVWRDFESVSERGRDVAGGP